MRDNSKILCLYFEYTSGLQISSRSSPEKYLKQLKEKYEDIMKRDAVDEMSKEQ